MIGAILTPGERTVAAILRVMGQQNEKQFQNYHRVLNRAKWSSKEISRLLLLVLVSVFTAKDAPIVVGIDETIERRRGTKIAARGIYRDPVRSSKEFFVKTSGLRWISMMLLTPIPWACRAWAVPFLTVLAPSERYHALHKKRHKTITDWARQMIGQLHRWVPNRALVVVADSSYAVLDFLAAVIRLPRVTIVTRLRLDAALYDPAPAHTPSTKGRPALKGKRQPTLAKRLAEADCGMVWRRNARGGRYDRNGSLVSFGSSTSCHRASCSFVIRTVGSSHRHCFAPIKMRIPHRSLPGLSCGGRSR
jgi:DDE superfamily endonuclease